MKEEKMYKEDPIKYNIKGSCYYITSLVKDECDTIIPPLCTTIIEKTKVKRNHFDRLINMLDHVVKNNKKNIAKFFICPKEMKKRFYLIFVVEHFHQENDILQNAKHRNFSKLTYYIKLNSNISFLLAAMSMLNILEDVCLSFYYKMSRLYNRSNNHLREKYESIRKAALNCVREITVVAEKKKTIKGLHL